MKKLKEGLDEQLTASEEAEEYPKVWYFNLAESIRVVTLEDQRSAFWGNADLAQGIGFR
jgi:hypothetical protein